MYVKGFQAHLIISQHKDNADWVKHCVTMEADGTKLRLPGAIKKLLLLLLLRIYEENLMEQCEENTKNFGLFYANAQLQKK